MPLISIIVPVFNVEDYLCACINSILNQTFSDFELILVDDGSTDNCGKICDELAEKDARIRVIHQENSGLSAARNAGIDIANGEYLTFIDSDDIVSPRYCESLYNALIESSADMSYCRFLEFTSNEELAVVNEETPINYSIMTGRDICLSTDKSISFNSACMRLYPKGSFDEIRFPEGRIAEDLAVTPIILYNSPKVAVLDIALYYYRQRTGSITLSHFSARDFDTVYAYDHCINFFSDKNEPEIVQHMLKKRQACYAKNILCAYQEKKQSSIPFEYKRGRLHAWKTVFTSCDSNTIHWFMEKYHPKAESIRVFFIRIIAVIDHIPNKIARLFHER